MGKLVAGLVVALALAAGPAASRPGAAWVDPTGQSPWVYTPEAQLPSLPMWEKNFEQALDRAVEVGYGWLYFSLAWHDVQLVDRIDLTGLDEVVIAAHDRGVRLVIDLQTCNFSLPTLPALVGGYRVNSNDPTRPTCVPRNIASVIPAWTAVAARYAAGGALAREQGWNDDYQVTHFEIENEPDSLPWVPGNWEAVPKDYALFLSKLVPAMRAVNPDVVILAPALAQHPRSLEWLDRMLSEDPASMVYASDEYRAAVAAGDEEIVGGGPFVDVWSYHEDFADWTSGVLERRPAEILGVIARHVDNPDHPTAKDPVLQFTEGGTALPNAEDRAGQLRWSWANTQMAFQVVGSPGVEFMDQNFSISNMDPSEDFQQQPAFGMARSLVEFFPDARHLAKTSEWTTAIAGGEAVDSWTWTDPETGLRSIVLWARSHPMGSGRIGQPFTIALPVGASKVLHVDAQWSRRTIATTGRVVDVTLQAGDPSPVQMIIELRQDDRSDRRGGTESPDVPRSPALPATGAGGILAPVLVFMTVGGRRRRRDGHMPMP